jgi:hypothetical protein
MVAAELTLAPFSPPRGEGEPEHRLIGRSASSSVRMVLPRRGRKRVLRTVRSFVAIESPLWSNRFPLICRHRLAPAGPMRAAQKMTLAPFSPPRGEGLGMRGCPKRLRMPARFDRSLLGNKGRYITGFRVARTLQ